MSTPAKVAPRYAVLPGRSAAAGWGRRKRCGQDVAAGLGAPKGRLNFLSARRQQMAQFDRGERYQ
jgi:hypothetical protein